MHSEFSMIPAPADMIRQAIASGLGICFIEHLDPDYPPTPDDLEFALDIPPVTLNSPKLKRDFRRSDLHIIFSVRSVCSFILNNIFTIF